LKPAEDGGQHLQCDVREILNRDWDFIGAHPECRYLTVSGMHWTTRGLRDPKLTTDAIAFAELLWDAIMRIGKGYLENSRGILSTRSRLGKYTQTIQPHNFGEDASKTTDLWIQGLPNLIATKNVSPRFVCGKCNGTLMRHYMGDDFCQTCRTEAVKIKPRWANQTNSGQNKLGPSEKRSSDRARTYLGIAEAMAKQWGSL
jgi:hypothetical protein